MQAEASPIDKRVSWLSLNASLQQLAWELGGHFCFKFGICSAEQDSARPASVWTGTPGTGQPQEWTLWHSRFKRYIENAVYKRH